MSATSESDKSERERLEQTIATLEAQRAILGDEAADAAIASLRRELNALDTAEPESGRRKEGERRVLTVLFSDVVGSTALAESMDPEAWTEFMNAIFQRLIEPVERYGGTVAHLMGDAILAFFGAPIAHEDDPQRATLAGLAILENIQPFRQQMKEEAGLSFDVRVGINTGLVVVAGVGSDTVREYTAMGDAVNLAARMEQTAQPGTVQIADNTYRLVAPQFEVEALGGIAVKGKAEPVEAYRVLGRKAVSGRLRGIAGQPAPLVGRERERSLLNGLISALDEEGDGAIVCLTGEAGLGKSRLIYELRDSDGPAHQWIEAASLSYERGQPYSLIQRLIRRLLGLAPGAHPARLRQRLESLVRLFPSEEQNEIERLFEALFGLEGGSDRMVLEGEAFKGRLFTAMTALWEERLRRGALILVCDDLHWTDPASAALLKHLLPLVERGPLLILLAMRPETHTPGWAVKEAAETTFGHRCTSVQLQPLDPEEGGQLVDSLLAIADLPPRLRTLIQEKTQGNPFFVEEVVRTLIDEGMVVRDESGAHWQASGEGSEIRIPDNVQALLTARIDRLEEAARTTLLVAAVVGRSFYYRVLARVVDLVGDLRAQLIVLQRSHFIQEAARQPELEYHFRHALTQEAAYSAILRRQRRVYHGRVGEALEALFPERREEFGSTLAFHFFQAREFQRALHYYTLAGDSALRLFAVVEAIDHYGRAMECAAQLDSVPGEKLVHLYTRRGRAYELDNQFEAALETYQRLFELGAERNDKALRLASLTARCILRATGTPLHDPARAKALGEEALALAQEVGNRAAEARVLWGLLLQVQYGGGDLHLALEYGRRSLTIARELDLREEVAYTLSNMASIYFRLNQFEESLGLNLEARAAWQELGNTPMLADSYIGTMNVELYRGNYRSVIAAAEEAIRLSRSIGNKWIQSVAPYYMGSSLLEQGQAGRALEYHHRGLRIAEEESIIFFKYVGYTRLLLLYRSLGAWDRGEPLAEALHRDREQLLYGFYSWGLTRAARLKLSQGKLSQAQQIHADSMQDVDDENAMLWLMTEVKVTAALIQLALGRPELALAELDQIIERVRQAGIRNQMAELLLAQAQALASLGRLEQAVKELREAERVAAEIGQRRVLWRIQAMVAELETRRGNKAAAETVRRRAREIVAYIAEHAGDDKLRESFIALPEVQSLLVK